MVGDLTIIFYWWFLLFGLGIIFLPTSWWLFRRFFDSGYCFAKIIAILAVSSAVWLLGSLRIFPFSIPAVWIIITVLALANSYLAKKFKEEFKKEISSCLKIIVFEELLFFLALTIWSFIRGFQPDIQGLEKFMDFGFVNSILRSQYFPPADIWMAGKTINYYYFGHLVTAVLTKISTLDSAITYNLMIATIFALTFTATFSLGANLVNLFSASNKFRSSVFAGFLSASLLTLGGNLHTLYWFLTHNFSFAGYWYPDATRFIVEKFGALDNTIHEFPIYSFVVSDLHGHVSDIPFVLLFLALIFSFMVSLKIPNKFLILNFKFLIPLALTLAAMYMTNSWDFPIYFLILLVVVAWLCYQNFGLTFQTFKRFSQFFIFHFSFFILFSLPFHLHFSQIAKGIAPVNAHSPFWQLLVLWGYQWTIGISFILFLIIKKRVVNYKLLITDYFILILFSVATLLVIIPEFIYVKDIYIPSYHRANTVFKLVYQSFMMYALTSGYIIVRVLSGLRLPLQKLLLVLFFSLLISFPLYYPTMAIPSYYGELKTYRGLWGLPFMQFSYPENLTVVEWLKKNTNNQPVILEAVGDSYTDYNQISMATGLPTVEGWLVHEWLWRGSFDEPGKRSGEVQTIYETKDQQLAKDLLNKYEVKYVIVGTLENKKYQVSEEKFNQLGKIIFQQGNTKVYLLD